MSKERAVLAGTRVYFNNASIRSPAVQIVQAHVEPAPDHVVGFICDPGVTVMVPVALDRRGEPPNREPPPWRRPRPPKEPPAPAPLIPTLPPQPVKRRV